MHYWHVAPRGYQRGTTLHAARELRRLAGLADRTPSPADDEAAGDGTERDDVVLLFPTREEAEARLAQDGGVLVRVELPEAPYELEDYHRHWRRIPGEWVKLVEAGAAADDASEAHAGRARSPRAA